MRHQSSRSVEVGLVYTGVSHLTFARQEFQAQVPPWIPLKPDLVVFLSGFVEIALGLSLLALYRYKTYVGLIAALFFVAVFPGNIAQYTEHRAAFGLNTDTARLSRLFLQPALLAWRFGVPARGQHFDSPRSDTIDSSPLPRPSLNASLVARR